jgi:transcriptional regulator with XRE-family HTH domain
MKTYTLYEWRKRRGWTQEELAAKAELDQATISNIENGRVTRPAYNTVFKLAAALEIDPRSLRFGQREAVSA